VDGVFIGPADLSAGMGYLNNPEHPEVTAAIDSAIARITGAGKAAGILHTNPARAKHFLSLGATFVAVGIDASLLARASESLAAQFDRKPAMGIPTQRGPY
jgi:4-hydroxy-2-oxoheptanedioate aldolase